MGYHRAGFDVVGVDVEAQPSFPFDFVEDDAFRLLDALYHGEGLFLGDRTVRLDDFSAIHASPPCQAYGAATNRLVTRDAPRFIEPIRAVLETIGIPFVIENVVGAPLRDPLVLCGSMFDLDVKRHRLFEAGGGFAFSPMRLECRHWAWTNRYPTHARKDKAQTSPVVHVYGTGGGAGKDIDLWRRTMGVEWMTTKAEIAEAIPPAYTEHVGAELVAHVGAARAL